MPSGDDLCKMEEALITVSYICCNIVGNSMYSLTVLNCCVYGRHVIDRCFVETDYMQDVSDCTMYI